MSLFDDIKAKADANGDGKVDKTDLESLKDGDNNPIIDQLKEVADHNADGKLDMSDLRNFDFNSVLGGLKDKFFK